MKYDQAKSIIWYPEVYTPSQIKLAVETIITAHAPDFEDYWRAVGLSEDEAR